MDIGDVISDSLKYPSSDWKKVIILGLLFMISFLIVPLFLAYGYVFRVIKASLAGVEELPDFEEWGEMLVEGIKLFLVYIIYLLPAIIIILYSVITFALAMYSFSYLNPTAAMNPTIIYSLMGGSFLFGIGFSIIYSLIVYPIMAVGIGNMAFYDGELGSAFRLGEILSTISSIGWVDLIIWYVAVALVILAIGFVGSLLSVIPILGWLALTLLVYPYLFLFFGRSIAWLYSSAFTEEYEP